jgi:hypothetical protein
MVHHAERRLTDESGVVRTGDPLEADHRAPYSPGMAEVSSWDPMRRRIQAQLERQTGEGVEEWSRRIAEAAPADESALRDWLGAEGVTGYPQNLLVWEKFGYPDFIVATADELLDGQYADRESLRPILDAVLFAASSFGEVSVQARKTYVSLVTPRRTFAIVQASTKKRVDVGLRLRGVEPHGNLLAARSLGNDDFTLRIALESVDDLDDAALSWLRRAHDESA